MHLSSMAAIGSLLCLAACGGSPGVAVMDAKGATIGHVAVADADHARITDKNGAEAGSVLKDEVSDKEGKRAGRITGDHRILNRNGTQVGRLSEGTKCLDTGGVEAGHLEQAVDPEAAGGACLVLLFPSQ